MSDNDEDYDEELDEEEVAKGSEHGEDPSASGEAVADAPAVKTPVEELPDEKPFSGEAPLHFGGSTVVDVRFTEKTLPAWLPYIVADDDFWFLRTVTQAASSPDDAAEGEGEAVVDTTAAVAPGAEDEVDEEGEHGDAPADAQKEVESALPSIPFDPNMKLVLEYTSDDPRTTYTAKVYVPPPPAEADEEGAEAGGAEPAPDAQVEGEDEEEDSGQKVAKGEGAADVAGEEEKDDASEIIIDVFTLCAAYSPSALKYCLTWKPKEDSGVAPLSFAGLEDWCLHTVGSDAAPQGSVVRDNLIKAAEMLQSDLSAAHDQAFRAKAVAADLETLAEEGGAVQQDEDGDASAPKKRQPLKATDVEVPALAQNKISFDFSWMFEKISANPKRYGNFLQDTIRRLLLAGFAPSKIIDVKHIRNSVAVQGYGLLLMRMPRTSLKKWIQPSTSGEDDGVPDPEEGDATLKPPLTFSVGTILLDVRTRNAKAQNKKNDLRQKGAVAHAKHLPKKFDPKLDPPVSTEYAARGYSPTHLELRCTDLLLMILSLSQPDFTLETFKTLYQAKVALPRELSSTTGLFHLLFHSLGLMDPVFGEILLSGAPQSVMCPTGLVNPMEWAVESSGSLPAQLNETFAKNFWDVVAPQEQVMDALKQHNTELYQTVVSFCEFHTQTVASVRSNSATVESLDQAVEKIGARTLCTPMLLHVAVEAINQVAAEWLFAVHRIVFVQATADSAPVLALQHSLESRNVAITSLLVHHGADLRTLWDNGKTNGLIYIADNWAINDLPVTTNPGSEATVAGLDAFSSAERKQKEEQNAIVQDLLALWKTREFERATDPQKKYGLMLSS